MWVFYVPDMRETTLAVGAGMRGYLRAFRSLFLYAAGFSLLINLLLLAPAVFMLQVFDRVLASHSLETLVVLGVGVAVALAFMLVLEVVRARLIALAAIGFDKLHSPQVLASELALAAAPGGKEDHHGVQDVATVRHFFSGIGILALFDAPWAIIYLAIIFLVHPLLGVTASAGMAALLLLTWINERLVRQPVVRAQSASRQMLQHFGASVRNAEVVSAMGMSPNLAQEWARRNAELLGMQEVANSVAGLVGGATKFTRQALQTAMLAVAAFLVIRQEVTAGAMIAATIIFGRALQPVEFLIASWRSLLEMRAALRRLGKLLPSAEDLRGPTELAPPTGALSVSDLRFSVPARESPVLDGVSFALAAGDALCVLGPSGSGKSTLARLVIGIWHPAAGTVRLDGADLRAWPRERLGPYLGYLPQDVELFAGTVAENIARMGVSASLEIIEAATLANAHDMILRLPQGYDTRIGEGGCLLSGGQRQRIALARALYGKPRLVVMDEPDASLDAEGEAALLRVIEGLKRDRVTQVIVSHRPSVVAATDKVLVLGEGRAQYFGSREEIATRLRQMMRAREGLYAIDASQVRPGGWT